MKTVYASSFALLGTAWLQHAYGKRWGRGAPDPGAVSRDDPPGCERHHDASIEWAATEGTGGSAATRPEVSVHLRLYGGQHGGAKVAASGRCLPGKAFSAH